MIKVQFKDGQTLSFDLNRKTDRDVWARFAEGIAWTESITAMGIHCKRRKMLHTLPVPNSGLRAYGFGAGLITGKPKDRILGESVWYCVDGMRIELIVYTTNQRVTKVTVSRLPVKSED